MSRSSPNVKLAALVALVMAGAAGAAEGAASPAAVRRVRLVATEAASAERWVAANVQAARRATISTRLSAAVRAVHVTEGQAVTAGQVLVRLVDSDLRGQLGAAQAALASASAHERRIRVLAAQRAATPSELEAATAQRAQAEAAVAGVRANLEYTELRAPFAGFVQARRVEPGDLVGPGQPLVTIEGSALELAASLSEEEARGLRVGQRLSFMGRDGASGAADVTALSPGGDALSHRRGFRARVVSGEPGLRSGAFVRVAVPGLAAAGVWLPRSALVERGDLTGVFVAARDRAELRWVSVGEEAGGRVAVRAGLRGGERVIDAPGALREGDAIEVSP
jgi:membrane fusion protein (multidrug efflux system)